MPRSGVGFSYTVITTGSCSVPLTVGMSISYLLFKLADSITTENSNMPGILYGIGLVVIAMATMTAFIAFLRRNNGCAGDQKSPTLLYYYLRRPDRNRGFWRGFSLVDDIGTIEL